MTNITEFYFSEYYSIKYANNWLKEKEKKSFIKCVRRYFEKYYKNKETAAVVRYRRIIHMDIWYLPSKNCC